MAYSKTLNVYWFCPPRTGSRSTSQIRKHFHFIPQFHQLPDPDLPNYYFVSNFRNPYSRAVSLFHLIFTREPDKPIEHFKKFLEKKILYEKNGVDYSKNIFYLSINNVFKKLGKQPDFLVRLENVVDDVKNLWFVKENYNEAIEKDINENLIQNKFKFEYAHKLHWKKYYNQEISEILYDYLEDDFKLGGYDKNSWIENI